MKIATDTLRAALAAATAVLGAPLAVDPLIDRHWFAGLGFFCSALWTAGLILLRWEVWRQSLAGVGLAFLTSAVGFYAFFFENRAFDVALDEARFEAAMALARPDATCRIVDRAARFESAMRACLLQANRDKLAAAGEGARQVYMPPELDLADILVTQAQGDAGDACREQFMALYAACPASFASMDAGAIQQLTASH
jgi:hypothetical protein